MAAPAAVAVGCCAKTNWLGAAARIVNASLSIEPNTELVAVSFFAPVKSMLKSLNAASPLVSVVLVVVPLRTPMPLLKLISNETPASGTLLPNESFNCTVTGGAIATPAVASVGCWVKATWLAAAGAMVNGLLATGVAGPLEAVNVFEPARLMLRLLNVATPLASVDCGFDPLSVPPPFKPSVTGTPGTLLVKLSATWTVTAGEIVTPAVASVGGCVNTNWLGAAAETVNGLLIAE